MAEQEEEAAAVKVAAARGQVAWAAPLGQDRRGIADVPSAGTENRMDWVSPAWNRDARNAGPH